MKFCPVVPEICRGQVHGARKERRIIIIRNGAKTISLQTLFGRLNKASFVGNICKFNLYKANTCLFRTQTLVPRRFGLNRFHSSLNTAHRH